MSAFTTTDVVSRLVGLGLDTALLEDSVIATLDPNGMLHHPRPPRECSLAPLTSTTLSFAQAMAHRLCPFCAEPWQTLNLPILRAGLDLLEGTELLQEPFPPAGSPPPPALPLSYGERSGTTRPLLAA